MAELSVKKMFKRFLPPFMLVVLPLFILWYMTDSKNFNLKIPKYYPIIENGDTLGYHTLPEFSFTDHQGKSFTSDSLKGQVHVGYFFFTACAGICPKMTDNVKILQDEFIKYEGIQLVGYTVDPKTDDVNRLRRHALKNDVDPSKWRLVTGPAQEIYKLAKKGYMLSAGDDALGSKDAIKSVTDSAEFINFVHSEKLVVVDKEGVIRGWVDGTDKKAVERFATDVLHVHLSYTRDAKESLFH